VTAETLLVEIERDRLHFEESDGGITFSGGEPLAQPEFLQELLAGCRARELHTAVDTAGHARIEIVQAAALATDLWLYDLKHPDPELHSALMGVDNTLILKNLEWLVGAGQTVWLRVPVIGGVNDDAPTMHRIGALARELGLDRLHLLPFHLAAEAKRDRFPLAEVEPAETSGASPPGRDDLSGWVASPPPSREQLAGLAAALRGYGLDVIIGG
jgi:pyruvate formate lyase activating enzyme